MDRQLTASPPQGEPGAIRGARKPKSPSLSRSINSSLEVPSRFELGLHVAECKVKRFVIVSDIHGVAIFWRRTLGGKQRGGGSVDTCDPSRRIADAEAGSRLSANCLRNHGTGSGTISLDRSRLVVGCRLSEALMFESWDHGEWDS